MGIERKPAILIASHLVAASIGGLWAWQSHEDPAPDPSPAAKASARGNGTAASPANDRSGIPETQGRRQNAARNREMDRKVEEITDFEAELDAANARVLAGKANDADYEILYGGFRRWLEHDRAGALRWAGQAEMQWPGGLHDPIFSRRTPAEIQGDLAAIRLWPRDRYLVALNSLGRADLEQAAAVYATLGTPEEREAFVKARIDSRNTEISEVLGWIGAMDEAEKTPLVAAIQKRLKMGAHSGFELSEANLQRLENEPEFASAAAEARWSLEQSAIRELAKTDLPEALEQMRVALSARGRSREEIASTLNSMKAQRVEIGGNVHLHAGLQAAKLGNGSAEQVMRDFIRRYEDDIGPIPTSTVQGLVSLGMTVDSEAAMRVAVDHLGDGDYNYYGLGWGIHRGAPARARAIEAIIDAGQWQQLAKLSKPSDTWDHVIGGPASDYFKENETDALEWAWSLGEPDARRRAIHGINGALLEDGRTGEAAALLKQLESTR